MSLRIKRLLLIGCALFAVFLSLSYRSGHVVPDDFIDARRATIEIDPKSWKKLDTIDWLQLAERAQQEDNLPQAQTYALNALSIDLSSGQAMMKLADLYYEQNQQQQAEQLAELAAQLATAQNITHIYLAAFWNKIGKTDKMLASWNVLLTRDPEIRQALFPRLQQLALKVETKGLIETFATTPPPWWSGFFNYLVREEKTPLPLLAHLYELRLRSSLLLNEGELTPYVNRLIKEKHWEDAYTVWFSGLPEEAHAYANLVYDGGFEGELHNTGFDWFFSPHKQITIQRDITFGMEGRSALRVSLKGPQHINFQHLWQRLRLTPAHYELSMRFRMDNFRTNKGLKWRIRCLEDNRLIAESPLLPESAAWQTLSVRFEIPADNCTAQLLRLEAASSYAHDQVFSGKLWFDAINILPNIDISQ